MQSYDVIVIGSGCGGLSAATYLAKAGKKVLLLEKHYLPGGCATSFVRGAYEFEASLHELCQMGDGKKGRPKGDVRKLLEDYYGLDIEWLPINKSFASIITGPNGYNVSMPVGVEAFIDEMEKQVPGSRESMTTVMELARMLVEGVEWLGEHENMSTFDKIKMMMKYGDLMRVVPVSTDEMLDRIGVPEKAKHIFESYWSYLSADSTNMSFAIYAIMTYSYLTQWPWIAKDRSHEISLAFDTKLRELGADVWYNSKVTKIDIENNQVRGVELADGTYIPCNSIISNLMPHVVFDRMVDPNKVPKRNKQLMNAQKIAQSCFTMYLGLDDSAQSLGLKGYDTFIRHNPDSHQQYLTCNSIDTHKDLSATIIDNAIPGISGEKRCSIQLSKFYTEDPFANVKEEEYFKLKDRITKETIEAYEQVTGCNIHDHIEEIVIASPITWARYLGTPRGDVYGYEPVDWDGMFPRVQSGQHEDYTVNGLRFVGGHGTQLVGYSQAFLSGVEQAKYMLSDMDTDKEGK